MDGSLGTQAGLRPFLPTFIPTTREQQDRIMSAGNNIHPNPVHPQYLQPRQQHTNFSGSPHHSGHHSGGTSPYSSSFPMNGMNPNLPAPTPYAQSLPSRASSNPASSSNSQPPPQQQQQQQQQSSQQGGYLDPAAYLSMGDVMGMDMDPIPMGSNMDMDLSILSAEEHGDLRVLHERGRARDRLHAQRLHSMSHPDGPDGTGRGRGAGGGRRKRSGSDDSAHEPASAVRGTNAGNRKQRGRPRLDTKDENAADRRRTQIRLAQRAYRLRKETTISSLRNRVTELETAIDGMQSTFLELHESAMKCLSKSNDPQTLGYGTNLKELTERFLSLSKGALGSSEGADSHDDEGEGENNDEGHSGATAKRRRSRDEDGGPESGGMQTNASNGVASYGGYEVSYTRQSNSRDSFNNNNGSQSRSNGNGRSDATTGRMGSSPTSNHYSDAYISSSPESGYANYVQPNNNSLQTAAQFRQDGPLPYEGFTYSFHETSFSRRLHRAALEHAHYMLTSPNADPQEVARMFAYTFCYLSKADVIRVVNRLLNTTTKESLHIRDYPEILPKGVRPEAMEAYLSNPDTSVFADGLTGEDMKDFDLRLEAKKMMLKMGINQKFLRPDEVEKYIMELGILTSNHQQQSHLIDPSLMEASKNRSSPKQQPERTLEVPEASTDYLTANRMPTPSYLIHPVTTPPPSSSPSSKGGESPSPSSSPHLTLEKKLRLFDTHSPPAARDELDTPTSTNVLEGVKKNFDIDVFVNQLVKKGVCLGRFPGFRKCDVEEAIRAAGLGAGIRVGVC